MTEKLNHAGTTVIARHYVQHPCKKQRADKVIKKSNGNDQIDIDSKYPDPKGQGFCAGLNCFKTSLKDWGFENKRSTNFGADP